MGSAKQSALAVGARLLRRHHRLLWWLFALNFVFAVAGTAPFSSSLRSTLDFSLAASDLYRRTDVFLLIELLRKPGLSPRGAVGGAMLLGILYAVVVLFLAGGILESYYTDRKLPTGEFFAACGKYFWRFVRLALLFLLAMVPAIILGAVVNKVSGRLASEAASATLGFWVQVAGLGIVFLLALAVRLCFDLAQIETLAESERAVRRSLRRAFGYTFRNLPGLLWMVLRIYVVGCALTAVALWVWVRLVPAQRAGTSILLGELVALSWLACGLWRRAAETVWYQQRVAILRVPAPEPPPEVAAALAPSTADGPAPA
jgi:hypothetical protein